MERIIKTKNWIHETDKQRRVGKEQSWVLRD